MEDDGRFEVRLDDVHNALTGWFHFSPLRFPLAVSIVRLLLTNCQDQGRHRGERRGRGRGFARGGGRAELEVMISSLVPNLILQHPAGHYPQHRQEVCF